jgi:spectinomycin phosphotransferase
MLEQPSDLTTDMITQELKQRWDIDAVGVRYTPLGYGSYNWTALDSDGRKWFVKSNRSTHEPDFLNLTHRSALALHEAGLDFVLAAIPDRTGDPRPAGSFGWDLAVFPFLDGKNTDGNSLHERGLLAETVGWLHASGVVPEHAVRWGPGWRQDGLRRILEDRLDQPWTEGPYGEEARALARADADGIHRLLDHSNRLGARLRGDDEPWVMTHGEPNDGNSMMDTEGRMHLIDCDVMMYAPRERDVWVLVTGDHLAKAFDNPEILAAYQRGAGEPVEPRRYVMELFRAERHLGEIAGDLDTLSGPHTADADVEFDLAALRRFLPVATNWPDLA